MNATLNAPSLSVFSMQHQVGLQENIQPPQPTLQEVTRRSATIATIEARAPTAQHPIAPEPGDPLSVAVARSQEHLAGWSADLDTSIDKTQAARRAVEAALTLLDGPAQTRLSTASKLIGKLNVELVQDKIDALSPNRNLVFNSAAAAAAGTSLSGEGKSHEHLVSKKLNLNEEDCGDPTAEAVAAAAVAREAAGLHADYGSAAELAPSDLETKAEAAVAAAVAREAEGLRAEINARAVSSAS